MKEKSHPKQQRKGSAKSQPLLLTLPLVFTPSTRRILGLAALLIAVLSGLIYVGPMKETIGSFGFPLDDPWIHLQFARNLADYGSFSYYQDQMVTSGSTSPLYVALGAVVWKIFADEFLVSYLLGILFFALSAYFLFRIALIIFAKEQWIAVGLTLAYLLTGRIAAIAVSGMETTLFMCLLLSTTYFYLSGRGIRLAVSGGLLLWSRPDGLLLLLILALHALYDRYLSNGGNRKKDAGAPIRWKSFFTPGMIFLILMASYFLFNLAHSGSFFPNTLTAKVKYYGGGSKPEYWYDVLRLFSSNTLGLFIAFFFAATVGLLIRLVRSARDPQSIFIGFVFAMAVAYWIELPFLYQDGRYLIPAIPFFLVAGAAGIRLFFQWLLNYLPSPAIAKFGNVLSVLILAGAAATGLVSWNTKRLDTYEVCRYINDRQVATARWIAQNTPPASVIATHDIGAISFYSERRIVDMVGLVSPEMIEHIGDLGKLVEFIHERGATHVAVLRNWFEITNQNPVFRTDEKKPEVMEVFEFRPNLTHFMPQYASSINIQAAQYLQRGYFREAFSLLAESYKADPKSARTVTLLAIGATAVGDTVRAYQAFQEALMLQPDYVPAMVPYAKLRSLRKEYTEAIQLLEMALTVKPDHAEARETLRQTLISRRTDSLLAAGYKRTRTRIEVPIN